MKHSPAKEAAGRHLAAGRRPGQAGAAAREARSVCCGRPRFSGCRQGAPPDRPALAARRARACGARRTVTKKEKKFSTSCCAQDSKRQSLGEPGFSVKELQERRLCKVQVWNGS